MIEHSGHAKLMDLGVIKVPLHRRRARLTASDEFLGTIRYADPEYLFHDRDDELADSWSLGLTLFHMLYGQPPYARKQGFAEISGCCRKRQNWFAEGRESIWYNTNARPSVHQIRDDGATEKPDIAG